MAEAMSSAASLTTPPEMRVDLGFAVVLLAFRLPSAPLQNKGALPSQTALRARCWGCPAPWQASAPPQAPAPPPAAPAPRVVVGTAAQYPEVQGMGLGGEGRKGRSQPQATKGRRDKVCQGGETGLGTYVMSKLAPHPKCKTTTASLSDAQTPSKFPLTR